MKKLLVQQQCPKRTFAFKKKAFPFHYLLLSIVLCLFGPDRHTVDYTMFSLPDPSAMLLCGSLHLACRHTTYQKNRLNVFRLMGKN